MNLYRERRQTPCPGDPEATGLWRTGVYMRALAKITGAALGGPALALAVAHGACAQQAQASGPEVFLTPYVWLPWVNVNVDPKAPNLSHASTTIDPGQIISHLTWIPFFGQAEVRDGRFGVLADFLHTPMTAGISTHDILFHGGEGDVTQNEGSAMLLYRVYADPAQYVDVGAGVRAWGLGGGLSLRSGLAPDVSVAQDVAWADGQAAIRYHRVFGDRFGATVLADAGAGGARFDWQGLATLDYDWNSWTVFHAGFRGLGFEGATKHANVSINEYGPFLSATFRFGRH